MCHIHLKELKLLHIIIYSSSSISTNDCLGNPGISALLTQAALISAKSFSLDTDTILIKIMNESVERTIEAELFL